MIEQTIREKLPEGFQRAEYLLDHGMLDRVTPRAKLRDELITITRMLTGLPYIVVLTHPTTGGVTASYAMLGDVQIAEPNALICFAGPRVIEQTIREKLPEGFQRAEYLLDHGMLDRVTHRRQMRDELISITRMLLGLPPAVKGDLPPPEPEAAATAATADPAEAPAEAEPAKS